MNALQTEFTGWLGYLDRWAVSWQVAFIVCVVITTAFTRRFAHISNNNKILPILFGPLALLGPGMLLGLVQIPSGIITQVGWYWALLSLINWIESRLKIRNPKNQLAFWLGRIVRPAIIIFAIIFFIERLSSLATISLISIGNFFNTDFVVGGAFLLIVGFYLIISKVSPS